MTKEHRYSKRIHTLAKRDGWRCHYCNRLTGIYGDESTEPTVDHFVPWSEGGANALWNLVLSCRDCNQQKSNMDGWTFKALLERGCQRR